jgi:uncharacterized protein (DUF433 family)
MPQLARNLTPTWELHEETIQGVAYCYYPLGEYIVSEPAVAAGLPIIKHTRITAGALPGWLKAGYSSREVAAEYSLPVAAVEEVARLAEVYDYERSYA